MKKILALMTAFALSVYLTLTPMGFAQKDTQNAPPPAITDDRGDQGFDWRCLLPLLALPLLLLLFRGDDKTVRRDKIEIAYATVNKIYGDGLRGGSGSKRQGKN